MIITMAGILMVVALQEHISLNDNSACIKKYTSSDAQRDAHDAMARGELWEIWLKVYDPASGIRYPGSSRKTGIYSHDGPPPPRPSHFKEFEAYDPFDSSFRECRRVQGRYVIKYNQEIELLKN